MGQLILIAQTSLDGFVAGANGGFDNFIGGEENLAFVCSITNGADATLMGRISYQLLNSAWPTAAAKPNATVNEIKYSNWYNTATKIVLSKTLKEDKGSGLFVINDDILKEVNKLKEQAGKNILIFGSPTAVHTLLELHLVDNIWLIVHPVLFGQGIRLFQNSSNVTKLQLAVAKQLSNGTLCNNYIVNK